MREVSFPSLNEVKSFRNALNSERGVFGPFMITGDPALVECAGYAGYDFVLLDMEHGPGSFEQLQNLIRAANVAKVMPVVRVPRGSDIFIDRALDVGAGAVLVPQVEFAEQAAAAVSAAKFSPVGTRRHVPVHPVCVLWRRYRRKLLHRGAGHHGHDSGGGRKSHREY